MVEREWEEGEKETEKSPRFLSTYLEAAGAKPMV